MILFQVTCLQMLRGLHSCGHVVGVVLPERILLQPELLLLDFVTGASLPPQTGHLCFL